MAESTRGLTDHPGLARRWSDDLLVVAPDAGQARWRDEVVLLERAWRAPHRSYHTLEHLAEVVEALDLLVHSDDLSLDDARIARLAAWYHDLAYDPRAAPGSNEHRSASLARDHLHRLGVDGQIVDLVEALVLMTLAHRVDPAVPDAHLRVFDAFHDADLWILSAPRERYDRYATQVRQEYAHVPTGAFARGRSAILSDLVGRPAIYRSRHATRSWEAPARTNVARELAALSDLSAAPSAGSARPGATTARRHSGPPPAPE